MKSMFSDKEVRILIFIIILSLIRGLYNLYILYHNRHQNLNYLQKMIEKEKDFTIFNIIQFILSILYILVSVYFVLYGKVKTSLFALVCTFMFARGTSYFMVRNVKDIPFIPNNIESQFVYYNFIIASLIQFLTAFYFIKVIFFG